jgi:hypothetical protein
MNKLLMTSCLVLAVAGCGQRANPVEAEAPARKVAQTANPRDIKTVAPISSADKPEDAADADRADQDFTMGSFDTKKQSDRIQSLRSLSDAELLNSLATKKILNGETIAEIIRRGSPPFLAELQRRYELDRNERIQETTAKPDVLYAAENDELRLLSALHRMKGLPDPAPVIVKGDKRREVMFPDMPELEVVVINKHPEQRRVAWTEGGNYRHGRRESFGFDVHRDDGKLMPVARPWSGFGGGFIKSVDLKSGEGWTEGTYLVAYAELLPPGRYRVRAAYAFGRDIGMILDKSATFMCFSEPIELVVVPHVIRLTPQERALSEQLSRALPADRPARMIQRGYEKDAPQGFISSESPPGRLLKLGWKAVPALIGALEDKQFGPTQRAWAFALLYMIAGNYNYPLGDTEWEAMFAAVESPLGPYRGIPQGARWTVDNGKELPAKISVEAQAKLAERWIAWKKYIDVREK